MINENIIGILTELQAVVEVTDRLDKTLLDALYMRETAGKLIKDTRDKMHFAHRHATALKKALCEALVPSSATDTDQPKDDPES